MVKFMILGMGAAVLLGCCSGTASAWGGKKNEGDAEADMPKGKDAVDIARMGFAQVAGDVGLLQDLLKDLEDPEMMKEVEKLMKDKNFQKEADAMINSKEWKNAYGDALKFLSDPEAIAGMQKQAQDYTDFLAAGPGKDGRRDMEMGSLPGTPNELGMNAAGMAAMDPNFMKDAMEMMQDPTMIKKVEDTMKNPEFQKSMREMMDSPLMKQKLADAGASMEQMMKDPELMAEAQKHMQAMMAGMGA